jgi:hypothetical protein
MSLRLSAKFFLLFVQAVSDTVTPSRKTNKLFYSAPTLLN